MKKLLLILLLLPLFTVSAWAEEPAAQLAGDLDIGALHDALPEELREIGGELRVGDYDEVGALERLWTRLLGMLKDNLRESVKDVAAVLGVSILCTLAALPAYRQTHADYIELAGCAAVSCLMIGGINSLFACAVSSLRDLSDYAKVSLPVVYSAAAASGAPGSASARYAVSCLALDLLIACSRRLILPLIECCLALAVCGSLFDNPVLRGGLKLFRRAAVLLMSGLSLAFTGLLSVTGIVTGSTDALAVKTAKTVIGAAVPVVGKMLSEAASALLAAAAVVRNTAGAFGLVAVCSICLLPFASLSVRLFLFSLSASVAEAMEGGRIARLMNDLASVMGLLLGMVGSFGLILFAAIVSAIRTVVG